MKNILEEEIEELTSLLREGEDWGDARQMLEAEGFEPSKLLLVALTESEDCKEYGVFVSGDLKVYEWVVDTNGPGVYILEFFRERTNDDKFYDDCPQIRVGLEMCKNT